MQRIRVARHRRYDLTINLFSFRQSACHVQLLTLAEEGVDLLRPFAHGWSTRVPVRKFVILWISTLRTSEPIRTQAKHCFRAWFTVPKSATAADPRDGEFQNRQINKKRTLLKVCLRLDGHPYRAAGIDHVRPVGVAPFDDDSGKHLGERHIQGGRTALRHVLDMAALRHNPALAVLAKRLAGKKPKGITVACMRKLLVIVNAIARNQATWHLNPV